MIGKKVQISAFAETPMEGVEEHLQIVGQEMPDTSQLTDKDVVIAVKSAAIGWVDLLMTSGQYQHQPPLPYTPGLEYCGTVIWTGRNIPTEQLSIGDKVLVDGFVSGPRSPGNYQQYGGFASYAVAPIEAILPIPERLDFDQG